MSTFRQTVKRIPGVKRLIPPVRKVVRTVLGPPKHLRYDVETVQVMQRVLAADSNCIDIGAHRGEILAHMLRFAPRGQHQAIEPIPHLADALQKQFPQVRVHSVALSDHQGQDTFNYVENAPDYSGLRQRTYDRPDPKIIPITVAVVRLDDLLPSDFPVRLIKLDVEGGEYDALRGGTQLIGRQRPIIVFEFGAGSAKAYGVTPQRMAQLLHNDLQYHITTMRRWLRGKPPLSAERFVASFERGWDHYYLAHPAGQTS